MKYIMITIVLVCIATFAKAQANPAETVASNIAQKMKDSLDLTSTQKDQIYQINMQLHEAKLARRQQYGASDSLRIQLQRVENSRDSLYRTILSEEKYQLYLQKKRTLVSNQ